MSLRLVSNREIQAATLSALEEIYCQPEARIIELLKSARANETEPLAMDMLDAILANAELAARDRVPTCQDTGLLVVFAQLGTGICLEEPGLREILGSAAKYAWKELYLRDSLALDPLRGQIPGIQAVPSDNSTLPLILHLEQVPGDKLTLHFCLKGGGAENCGALRMFAPTASLAEIGGFIVSTVVEAGGKPCPPVLVGVGIGGDFELCALMAKQALVLPRNASEQDGALLPWEQELLRQINAKGKGVQGMGGQTTVLDLRILTAPCHIASLPVAVNIECHAHRSTSRVI